MPHATRMFNVASTASVYGEGMIDLFSLGLSHGLLLLAAWRLLARDDLDHEPPGENDETQSGA